MAIKLPRPLQSGYSVRENIGEFLQVTLDGGAPRMRRNIAGAWKLVDCVWIFNDVELRAFEEIYYYFSVTGKPFVIDLVLTGPLKEYDGVFTPQNKRIGNVRGNYYEVTATILVKPSDFGQETIAKWDAIQEINDKYPPEFLHWFQNRLHRILNNPMVKVTNTPDDLWMATNADWENAK